MLSKTLSLFDVGLAVLLAGCTAALSPTADGYGQRVYYDPALPPAPLSERVPPRPAPQAYWQPGHWTWNGVRWVWRKGYYVEPPKTATAWIPGHWDEGAAGYTWIKGRWE